MFPAGSTYVVFSSFTHFPAAMSCKTERESTRLRRSVAPNTTLVLQRKIYAVILCLCFWKIALKELRTFCFVFLLIEGLRWSAVVGKGYSVLPWYVMYFCIYLYKYFEEACCFVYLVSVVISKQGSHIAHNHIQWLWQWLSRPNSPQIQGPNTAP